MDPEPYPPAVVRRDEHGYSLLELIVVTSFIGILATIGIPALHEMMHRHRVDGAVRLSAALMHRARSEAVKRSRPAVILPDTTRGTILGFVDTNDDHALDEGDIEIGKVTLPKHVEFVAPADEDVVTGFTEGIAIFQPDGSIRDIGAIRMGDSLGNHFEVRVSPAITARVTIRKHAPDRAPAADGSHWFAQGEGGATWSWR